MWYNLKWIPQAAITLSFMYYMWIRSTIIYLPRCLGSCITTCLRAWGTDEEAENVTFCFTDFGQRGDILLSLREIRVKYYLRMGNHGQSFPFLADRNSQRLYQRLVESSLVLFICLVVVVHWSSIYCWQNKSCPSWHWVSFSVKVQASLYQILSWFS